MDKRLRWFDEGAPKLRQVGGIVRLYAVLSAESVIEGHPAQDYFQTSRKSHLTHRPTLMLMPR